jgi:hypothetical protein
MSAARRKRESDRSVGRGDGTGAAGRPAAGIGPVFDFRFTGRAILLMLFVRPVEDYTTPCHGWRIASMICTTDGRGQDMRKPKHTVSLLALAAWIAIVISAEGQSGSDGTNPDKRLSAWDKQLVLPSRVSAKLVWAERRLQPSGLRKLRQMGGTLAPAIAAGDDFDPLRDRAKHEVITSFPGLAATDVSEAAFIVLSMATKDMDDDIRMIMAEIRATNAAKQKMRELIKELNGWISREMSKYPESEDIDNEKVGESETPARAVRPAVKTAAPAARRATFETKTSPVIHLDYVKAPAVPPLPPRNSGLTVSALKSLRDDLKGNLDGLNEMSEMTALRLQMTMDRRSKFIQTLSNIMKKASTTQEKLAQNIK